ncbi:MAG: zinc-ribbon domain-containing protein [Candidatus Binatia bacterium]
MGNESSTMCPHCGAENQATSTFCESCGKALPSTASTGPRLVTDTVIPSTAAGRQLVSEELQRYAKKAKNALLAVAIIQCVFGLIIYGVASANLPSGQSLPPIVLITIFGIGAIFFGLYAWARHSPLPAAIVGLTLFVTMHLVDGLVDPTQFGRGIIMKVIIVVMLVQAIQAGIKYKRLLPQLQAN